MRFKEFLKEDSNPLQGYLNTLDTMIKNEIILYRGTRGSNGKVLKSVVLDDGTELTIRSVEARAKKRISMTTSNILLTITSHADAWSELPPRNMSYMFSRDYEHAGKFGDISLIIPADSVKKFGYAIDDFNENQSGIKSAIDDLIVNVSEIFENFSWQAEELSDELNERLESIAKSCGLSSISLDTTSVDYDVLVSQLEFIDEVVKLPHVISQFHYDMGHLFKTISRILKKHGWMSLIDAFEHFTPKDVDMRVLTSLAPLGSIEAEADEVWFDGSYLAIEFSPGAGSYGSEISDKEYAVNLLERMLNTLKS